MGEDDDSADEEAKFRPVTLPGHRVPSAYVCLACGDLVREAFQCAEHRCRPAAGSHTMVTEATRVAVQKCVGGIVCTPASIAACIIEPPRADQARLPVGYACKPPRQNYNVHDTVKEFIKKGFADGDTRTAAGRAVKKLSPATCLESLKKAMQEGRLEIDEDDLPELTAIQSIFNSLAARKRREVAAAVAASRR